MAAKSEAIIIGSGHNDLVCGTSTHTGGGVSGVPGRNAAREILRDWRRLQ